MVGSGMTHHARYQTLRLAIALTFVLAGSAGLAGSVAAQGSKNAASEAMAPRSAQKLVDEAVAAAKAARKNVLVEFGASWCGWCKRFETFLAEPTAGKLMLDNFVVVHLVVQEVPDKKALENDGGAALMAQMGGGGGLPYFFMLDAAGKKIGDANIMPNNGNVGHPNTPEEVRAFDALLARTAPRMSAAERGQVREYLTRIAKGSGA
jgi:thiol:disulfide interchange protein